MSFPVPSNETERLQALDQYAILDTMPEDEYDDVARLAAEICGTAMSTVALLDGHRKWHKAKYGVKAEFVPREISICSHTVMGTEPLVVPDTHDHEVFKELGMVKDFPFVRFYAGIPFINPEGYALGTLCVIDQSPKSISDNQLKTLGALTRQVSTLLELRRTKSELERALAEKELALEHVEVLSGLVPICCVCKQIRGDDNYWSNIEDHLARNSDLQFSHGYCPDCEREAMREIDAAD